MGEHAVVDAHLVDQPSEGLARGADPDPQLLGVGEQRVVLRLGERLLCVYVGDDAVRGVAVDDRHVVPGARHQVDAVRRVLEPGAVEEAEVDLVAEEREVVVAG